MNNISTTNRELFGFSLDDFIQIFASYNEPTFRAKQVFQALYKRYINSIDDIYELPKLLRSKLTADFRLSSVNLINVFSSTDGTRRYLFKLIGNEAIETVWIPEVNRATICISSQVGCSLGCEFCLTAQMGFKRNLTVAEIVHQIVFVLKDEAVRLNQNISQPLNIVLMGMGEPLLNYDNVMKAIQVITSKDGLNIAPRRITLSTAGIVPRIYDLGQESVRPHLAISLSAPNDKLRDKLMPINLRYPLSELLKACMTYPLSEKEFITFEYVMINEINDKDEHAYQVIKLTSGLRTYKKIKINLIPHNPEPRLPFQSSSESQIIRFQNIIKQKHIPVFIRRPRGRDITAACGQLAANFDSSFSVSDGQLNNVT